MPLPTEPPITQPALMKEMRTVPLSACAEVRPASTAASATMMVRRLDIFGSSLPVPALPILRITDATRRPNP